MLIQARSTTRSTPRHAVDIPCEIITSASDEPALSWATDMSADGLWIEQRDDLALGQELVVCFRPGIWWRANDLMIFANVARASPGLRSEDDAPGVGLAFVDLSSSERWALRSWLRPRPEKAPSRRRRSPPRATDFAWPAPVDGFMTSPFARRVD